jgi:translation initiation factor IF-1
MSGQETILLDARLESVIEPHAFRAVLGNGHRFTAFVAARDRGGKAPEEGDWVKVEMSPYDMSAGRIVDSGGL